MHSESRFHRQTLSPVRPPLHEIFAFLSNIRPRLDVWGLVADVSEDRLSLEQRLPRV